MRVKKSIMSVVVMGALIGLSGQAAMASTPASYLPPVTSNPTTTGGTLVALGDSITFGYGLSDTNGNTNTSAFAFPSLLGASSALSETTVDNLGVVGATSQDLLNSLSTATVQTDLSKANVVTIDIGSNDLLTPAVNYLKADLAAGKTPTLTKAQMLTLGEDVTAFGTNLAEILSEVHAYAPNAYIVLYNIYDPIPTTSPILNLYNDSELLIGAANKEIQTIASTFGLTVADAHTNIDSNIGSYIAPAYPLGVHPNKEGQKELALVGETALSSEVTAWQTAKNQLAGSLPEVPFAGVMPLLGFGALAVVMLVARSRYSTRHR